MSEFSSSAFSRRHIFSAFLLLCALWLLAFSMAQLKPVFASFFPDLRQPMYEREHFLTLTWAHFKLVGLSSLVAILLGVSTGIAVTRRAGREFEPLVSACSAIGQTFPPAAVLAIAVPIVGFGFWPALLALVLYGLLPIVENTIRAINGIAPDVIESSHAMGMSAWQRLRQVELPLAWPLILAGVRVSVMINIGTATIGSTVGAKSLGTPIIAGLMNQNAAYVIQGAALVALMALSLDRLFEALIDRRHQQSASF